MEVEYVNKVTLDWSNEALSLMRELLPTMAPVASFPGWREEQRSTVGMLLSAAARSTESTILLCSYGQLWDAELVLRSVTEATVKFAYLLQSRDEFEQRIEEYSLNLFDIALLKDDKKVRELLRVLPEPDLKEFIPLRERLLSEAERSHIEEKYDKRNRSSIEGRWGFTRMISTIENNICGLKGFSGLAYNYSIASHIQHADFIGISLPIDRDDKEMDRKLAQHLAHFCRLLLDVFAFFQFRLIIGYKFADVDLRTIHDVNRRVQQFISPLEDLYQEWIAIEYGEGVKSN